MISWSYFNDLVFLLVGLIVGAITIKLKYSHFKSPKEFSTMENEKSLLQGKMSALEQEKNLIMEKSHVLETQKSALIKQLAQVETQLEEKSKNFEKIQDEMNQKFHEMAQGLLLKMGSQMEEKGRLGLEGLLNPLKVDLEKFKLRIDAVHIEETKQRSSLEQQVKILMGLNEKMTLETASLTKALVGDNKTQGDWGEFQVEMILDNAGLRLNEEYIVQGEGLGLKNDEGGHQRPDFLIKIPGEKHLIIDSKVSLKSYKDSVDHMDDKSKCQIDLKAHVNSVISHIDELSKKHYQSNTDLQSPDFVLMFMPIEPAFTAALNEKRDLLNYAWKKKIIPVTPTNLFAVMKTVASIWKVEKQNKNAEEIAKRGAALYDKVYGFVSDMKEIGTQLDKTQKKYHDAFSKLSEGRGNLLSQVQKLEELGVKVKKQIEI